MTAAAMTRSLVETSTDSQGAALVTALEVVTVAACLALSLAFAHLLFIQHVPGTVIVCTDTPERC